MRRTTGNKQTCNKPAQHANPAFPDTLVAPLAVLRARIGAEREQHLGDGCIPHRRGDMQGRDSAHQWCRVAMQQRTLLHAVNHPLRSIQRRRLPTSTTGCNTAHSVANGRDSQLVAPEVCLPLSVGAVREQQPRRRRMPLLSRVHEGRLPAVTPSVPLLQRSQ